MKILRILILLLLSTFSLSAQFYFNKNYDFNGENNTFRSLENHNGNQTITIGVSRSIDLENKITFSFLDGLGNESRSLAYGDPLIQYRNIFGILDENVLVVSATYVENGQEDFVHAFLMKMSLFGEVIWTQKTGLENRRNVTKRHIATSDGGYLLVGYTDDYSSGSIEGLAYGVKVDSLGSVLWEKTYGTADSLESIFDVVETDDNHYLFLGQQSDGDNGAEHGQNQDIWLMKADQNGEVVWEKKHGDIFFQEGNDIQKVEGGYVIAGITNEENVGHSRPFGWILKVDENGEYLWERKYAGISYLGNHWRDTFLGVRETQEGDLVILGVSDNFNTAVTNMGILVKMTADGDSLWTKAYHNNIYHHIFYDFELAEDGGFNICGWTDYGVESGTRDGWVLKLDSLGDTCQPANCDSIFTTSIHYDITTHYPTHFYPNPAQNRVTFQHRLPKGKEAVLEVYDLKGELMVNYQLLRVNEGVDLDIEDWESGLYLYKVSIEGREVSSGKLVVE